MSQPQDGAKAKHSSTTFFVVPLKPAAGSAPAENLVHCAYFNAAWHRVQSKEIATDKDSDSIAFQQQDKLPPDALASLEGEEPDSGVALFAAVAKTLDADAGLPHTFLAVHSDGLGSLEVPVRQYTKRGVVLIFRRPAEGGAKQLIATADPEIRNGGNG